jgi:hypothetical protein
MESNPFASANTQGHDTGKAANRPAGCLLGGLNIAHQLHTKTKIIKNMKSNLIKLSLILVVVAGVVFVLRSQPSTSAPSRTYDTYGNDGRYRLLVEPSSGIQFVIDTQSGRVWHSVVDVQNNRVVFVSSIYRLAVYPA